MASGGDLLLPGRALQLAPTVFFDAKMKLDLAQHIPSAIALQEGRTQLLYTNQNGV